MRSRNDLSLLKLRPHSDQKGRHILHGRRVAVHASQVCVLTTTPAKNPGRRRLNDDVTNPWMILKMALRKIGRRQPSPTSIAHPIQRVREAIDIRISVTLVIRDPRAAIEALKAFWSRQGIGINEQIGINL